MRILVTGGTGFVGCHSVKALVDAGHDVRLLVRSRERIAPALGPLGFGELDHVLGDVTDPGAVVRAMEGCDAVLHAANVYKLDSRAAKEMLDVNPRGTEIVLRAARERGLDPIVHVSTCAALVPTDRARLEPGGPLGSPPGAYSRSKVEAERIARRMQADGAPVVITWPGGVLGPHDPRGSDFVLTATDVIRGLIPMRPSGATPAVDVRDVAAVHAAVFELGRGPRGYIAAAELLTLADMVAVARRVTGRRIPGVPIPGAIGVGAGRAADVVQRVLPMRLPINSEGPWLMVHGKPPDPSSTIAELRVSFRPVADSLADTYRWLWQAGRITRRQAGRLAAEPAAVATN